MRLNVIWCENEKDSTLMYRLLLQLGEKVYNDNAIHSPFDRYPSIICSGGVWCGYKDRNGISVKEFIDGIVQT